jgi:2-amino-4-hydroxy-6-hydroxymethyldihydropteridine diphosphokinase
MGSGGRVPLMSISCSSGDRQIRLSNLIVPHPRYAERRFVLLPLAELLPDFRDPASNLTVQQLIERCPDSGEVRLHAPPLL